MKKPISMTVIIFLFIVAALHVLRLVLKIEVAVDGTLLPQWISIFGILVPAGLAVMLKRESSR
jgi:hypothetical protein